MKRSFIRQSGIGNATTILDDVLKHNKKILEALLNDLGEDQLNLEDCLQKIDNVIEFLLNEIFKAEFFPNIDDVKRYFLSNLDVMSVLNCDKSNTAYQYFDFENPEKKIAQVIGRYYASALFAQRGIILNMLSKTNEVWLKSVVVNKNAEDELKNYFPHISIYENYRMFYQHKKPLLEDVVSNFCGTKLA